jgi:hypothetical protein
MGIDDPEGSNSFWYKIGYDLKDDGTATFWTASLFKDDLGGSDSGGGVAIADINGNQIPDLLLMAIDDPEGSNSFWYTIGWDFSNPAS